MNRRGLTIIEVLTTIVITAILMLTVLRTFSTGLNFDERFRTSGATEKERKTFENDVKSYLSRAYLNPISTDEGSFFIASQGALSGGEATESPDTLTFTTIGNPINSGVRNTDTATTTDFDQLNEQFGPQGGVSEICITPSPIGTAPSTDGLFIRKQTPADGDPTQGGRESQLSPLATSIQFQFYNGTDWQGTWDTRQQATKRLPASIRMTYKWDGETTDRTITILLSGSDVTAENPITEGTS